MTSFVFATFGCAVACAVAGIFVIVVVVHNRLLARRAWCDHAWIDVAAHRRRRQEILAEFADLECPQGVMEVRLDAESRARLRVQRQSLAANTRALRSAEHFYDEMVRDLNADLARFPARLVGRVMGCRQLPRLRETGVTGARDTMDAATAAPRST